MTTTLGVAVHAYDFMSIHASQLQTPGGNLSRAMHCLYGQCVRHGLQGGHREAWHPRAVKSRVLRSDTCIEQTFATTEASPAKALPLDAVVARVCME
jgi:hypothetical protein